jgi:hypothetical protein
VVPTSNQQLDIKTAFLNGELPGELFMRCPPGFETPGKIWRLHKAIYGLKQAAQTWYETMKRQLHEKGFSVADSDQCLYIAHLGGSLVLVVVHVDDCLIAAAAPAMQLAKDTIRSLYEMKDLGPALLPRPRNCAGQGQQALVVGTDRLHTSCSGNFQPYRLQPPRCPHGCRHPADPGWYSAWPRCGKSAQPQRAVLLPDRLLSLM